ncbi:hypothetical protein CHLNCDRAFT_137930 [Chlorella variabilis]|uniref:Alcohol dehydrogenase-like C-terminal domain-containing protein n=1 Tax=Chlorella variabilis TaxID=554065 RepID=E1Z4V4_CHLVA|nr:hypothetical protein CHLNCDRAFT_137930 [Chlorella variabilis]EFN59412.1 hypothetical protein CHLNCDRAFT_137930 [Chlorella variabilis]|eukprot:XP_005851514.1 hypothetical protein CHLNCDRAFT_137930 [Chlorella variabilis]
MQDGTLDPQFVITHTPPLKEAAEAYRMFNDKQTIKVVMKPGRSEEGAGATVAKEE